MKNRDDVVKATIDELMDHLRIAIDYGSPNNDSLMKAALGKAVASGLDGSPESIVRNAIANLLYHSVSDKEYSTEKLLEKARLYHEAPIALYFSICDSLNAMQQTPKPHRSR